jgi:putative flippase GtrA
VSEYPPKMLLPPSGNLGRLLRQFTRFFGVGVAAMIVHYATMIVLVELFHFDAVQAALAGYVTGGLASYGLNHRYTYDSTRSHGAAGWRFAVVAGVGFGMTYALMALMTRKLGWHYLPSQLITTGIVMMWSFFAHKFWSFGEKT